MSIEHVPGWATSGTKTAPSSGLSSSGYVGGEQPAAVNFNYLTDEERAKINEIIDEAPDGFPPNLSDQDHIERKRIYYDADSAWSHPGEGANVISGGATKAYVDAAMYTDTSGDKKLLALNAAALAIDVYDIGTMAYESTSGTLPSLPSGGGQTWVPTCMCFGAGIAYVCFTDTNATPDTHQIQAYDVTTWLKYAPWPSTGTTLPGTGTSTRYDRVEFVGNNRIATTNTWNTISSSSSAAITIINTTTGAITASGAGDNPETGGVYVPRRLCGDGTYIYFTDDNGNVSSLTIATPTTGCGGTNWPYTDATGTCFDIKCTGRVIVSSWSDGTNYRTLSFHTRANADAAGLESSTSKDLTACTSLAFDGLCIWGYGYYSNRNTIARINIGHVNEGITLTFPIEDYTKYATTLDFSTGQDIDIYANRLVFDGRDIFALGDRRASQTLSGYIFRIPRAVLR